MKKKKYKDKLIQPLRMQPDYGENNINDRLDDMRKKQAIEILKIAYSLVCNSKRIMKKRIGSQAEEEIEKLLKVLLSENAKWKNKVFSVGGYERDKLMNVDSKDLDLVVEKKNGGRDFAKFLHSNFPRETSNPYEMGRGYPIWHINFKDDINYKGVFYKTKGAELDIVDTQKESFPDPNSRQRITTYGDIKEDIARRDFTTNMLLRDMTNGEIVDLTGRSKSDIEKGLLREHPDVDINKMFSDDPLRMLRLVRFQVKYNWDIPYHVLKAVKRNAKRINIISNERINDELVKIMKMGKLRQAVKLMKSTGLLKYILPEVQDMIGVEHDTTRGVHLEGDAYKHTLEVLKHAKPTVVGQLSALLHDIGKPKTQEILEDKIQYFGHEEVGAEIAEAIMKRLKFDNSVVKKVKNIVLYHMRPHSLAGGKSKALRKFIRTVGVEMVDAILDMAEADTLGTLPPKNYIPELRKKIEEVQKVPVKEKPLLNGREIMEALNIKSGKIIGKIKEFLKELEDEYVADGKTLTKEEAIERIKNEFK